MQLRKYLRLLGASSILFLDLVGFICTFALRGFTELIKKYTHKHVKTKESRLPCLAEHNGLKSPTDPMVF